MKSLFTFESLSAAGTAFGTGDVSTPNEGLVKALTTTLDSLDLVIGQLMTMERFVMLTIPKMEDGNNFGVTVQLAALKHMKDERELLSKALEELSKYYSCRADAIEKCKLPTTNSTKTSVQCNSSGESKGGEKEGKTTSTETKVEEKTTQVANEVAELAFRKQAIVAVDVLFYSKAKTAMETALTAYTTTIDFLDKNKEKIEKPKGSAGRSGYSSMY